MSPFDENHARERRWILDPCAVPYQATSDVRSGPRPRRRFRGSHRRLKQIRMRGNSSWELWVLLAWIVFLLAIVLPWMVRQMP